jgi:hypothetical protein
MKRLEVTVILSAPNGVTEQWNRLRTPQEYLLTNKTPITSIVDFVSNRKLYKFK